MFGLRGMLALRARSNALQPPVGGVRGSVVGVRSEGAVKIIFLAGVKIGLVQGAEIGGEANDLEVFEVQDRLQVQDRLEAVVLEAVAVDDRSGEVAEGVVDRCHVIILCACEGGVKAMRGKSSSDFSARRSKMF